MSTTIQHDLRMRKSGRMLYLLAPILSLLIGLIISATISPPVAANSIPAACLHDDGDPVEPLPYPGAWAIILNFNHAPSTTETEACWAERTNNPANPIEYTTGMRCLVRQNTKAVSVGNGSADFDGNFHITCPRRHNALNPGTVYDTFYVRAVAEFDAIEAIYPLVTHSNVAVKTGFKGPNSAGEWTARLVSRYGVKSYEDSEQVMMAAGVPHTLISAVANGSGTHIVNQSVFDTPQAIDPFEFDYTELIFIGGGRIPWTLHEIVIDPPGLCQSNC